MTKTDHVKHASDRMLTQTYRNGLIRTTYLGHLENSPSEQACDFGAGNNRLNDTVIQYVLSYFGASLAKNKGDAKGFQKSVEAMVLHAFGSHDLCGNWCEDPKSYKHKNLLGGNDLVGNGLRASLEETLKPYMTDEGCG